MSTYVLIHGSWHGGWCWDRVAPLLRNAGHHVETPDLPGHGADATPVSEITLQRYVDRVCDVLDAQAEPVILVGHSHGGVVVTQAAEQRPGKIRTLVYLAGYLPRNGESLLDLARQDPDMSRNVLPFLDLFEEQGYATVQPEHIREAFYHDCSDADAAWAAEHVRGAREPLASPATPMQITPERFGRIPRVYIACLDDRAISPALQKLMYTNTPCGRVVEMHTSHSPFLAAPETLAGHLLALADAPADRAEQNKAVVRRFVEEAQTLHRVEAVDEYLSDDFVDHTPMPGFSADRVGVKGVFTLFYTAFAGFRAVIEDQVADGDRVMTRKTFYGTHQGAFMGIPPTGRPVQIKVIDVLYLRDGMITDHWGAVDQLGLMQQLGVVPAPEAAPA